MSDSDTQPGPDRGERVITTRWWVSRLMGRDAVCLYVTRYVTEDGAIVEQHYLNEAGNWRPTVDYVVIEPALTLTGLLMAELASAPDSLRDNPVVGALLRAIRTTIHGDNLPTETHEVEE